MFVTAQNEGTLEVPLTISDFFFFVYSSGDGAPQEESLNDPCSKGDQGVPGV